MQQHQLDQLAAEASMQYQRIQDRSMRAADYFRRVGIQTLAQDSWDWSLVSYVQGMHEISEGAD